jgi:hypothetical protein
MSTASRIFGTAVLFSVGLAACGRGSSVEEESINLDYSTLQLETDAVRYDASYIYFAHPQTAAPQTTVPQPSRSVLALSRTGAASPKAELISNYVIKDEQGTVPRLYQTPGSD